MQLNKLDKKEIQLIKHDANTCTFYPGFKCPRDKETIQTNEFSSRIKIKSVLNKKEIEIGKKIQEDPAFRYYFAPIIDECEVDLATIDKSKIEKCSTFKQSKKISTFVSQKSYITKDNINFSKYLNDKLFEQDSENYIEALFDTHIYLLEGLKKLNELGIIHFGLSTIKIIYDNGIKIPIITDFSQAFFNDDSNKETFSILYEDYPAWPIEVILLSYIKSKIPENKMDTNIENVDDMKKTTAIYLTRNSTMRNLIEQEDRHIFAQLLSEMLDGFIGKTYTQVWKLLYMTNKSWDNYALCAIYLQELNNSEINQTTSTILKEYIQIIKNILLSDPNKRPLAIDTSKLIKSIIKSISKKEYETTRKAIKKITENPEYKNTINKKYLNQILLQEDHRTQITLRQYYPPGTQ
jgi:hypothetical protein